MRTQSVRTYAVISVFSLVDVNDDRLTSCAGNYDDGIGENGALITVGGVGDDTANPADPLQQPGDGQEERVDDDELYDIASFTDQGDTELTITTSNPSQDDNLFLAVVQIAAQTTVANEICDDEVDNDGDNLVDFMQIPTARWYRPDGGDDADNPNDLRATCYVDWGGVKYPVQVGVPPSSVNEETGRRSSCARSIPTRSESPEVARRRSRQSFTTAFPSRRPRRRPSTRSRRRRSRPSPHQPAETRPPSSRPSSFEGRASTPRTVI